MSSTIPFNSLENNIWERLNQDTPLGKIPPITIHKVVEIMEHLSQMRTFNIMIPGGNDTCLIDGIINDPLLRKKINDTIMREYPNVEQVGFIDETSTIPRLEMAWWEFCGNATRSFVYKFFWWNTGEWKFSISGTDRTLNAGIKENWEVWSEMPIYKDVEKIKQDKNGNYIVEMQGITHYICYDEYIGDKNDPAYKDILKQKTMEKIRELWLDTYPASWIMYVKQDGEWISIEPVVYVKSIDSLFYETACWSGTTAVWMVEALKNKKSTILPILQPSWQKISIEVRYNEQDKVFENAIISWLVNKVTSGNIDTSGNTQYIIEQCYTPSELAKNLDDGLNLLYKNCFKGYPYFELFSDEEIENIFQDYIRRWKLFLSKKNGEVIGFSSYTDITWEQEICEVLTPSIHDLGWDMKQCKYLADLGIKEEFRKKDIWRSLVVKCMNELMPWDILIMRTSNNNLPSWNLFASLGFKEMVWVYQNTSSKRQDGEVTTDKRKFSYYIK